MNIINNPSRTPSVYSNASITANKTKLAYIENAVTAFTNYIAPQTLAQKLEVADNWKRRKH